LLKLNRAEFKSQAKRDITASFHNLREVSENFAAPRAPTGSAVNFFLPEFVNTYTNHNL